MHGLLYSIGLGKLQKRWQKLMLVVTRSKPQFGHGLFDPPKVVGGGGGGGGGGGVFLVTASILASLLS